MQGHVGTKNTGLVKRLIRNAFWKLKLRKYGKKNISKNGPIVWILTLKFKYINLKFIDEDNS